MSETTLDNPDVIWNRMKSSNICNEELFEALKKSVKLNVGCSKLRVIVKQIEQLTRGDKTISILDYGSGGGQLVTYLFMLGYNNIVGVDVYSEERVKELNGLFSDVVKGNIFYSYDTITLPFLDNSFDLIVSQQVIEHVSNIEQYFYESRRVMTPAGKMFLDFPHRLVPFDTHTRMWFVHYFPGFVRKYFYNKYREGSYERYCNKLYLRTPSFFYRLFDRMFANYNDLSRERIANFSGGNDYEGNVKVRRFVDKILHLPIVGMVTLNILSIFFNKSIVIQNKK